MMRVSLLLLFISVLARDALGLVGGQNAILGDFNWMGSLRDADKMHVCGVVLVNRNWVLTAGHCVGGIVGYTLEFGHVVRGGGYIYPYDWIYRHPMYDENGGAYLYDFALIHVEGNGVEIEQIYTEPITFFDDGSSAISSESCWIAGWGALSSGGSPPSQLQKAQIPAISDAECADQWGSGYNPALHVCAYNETSQAQSLCDKDEGGSLVCSDESGNITLVGLGSFFYPECNPAFPSVFVRISTFGEWTCGITGGVVCW